MPGLADTLDAHGGFAEVVASLRAGHGGTIGGTWGSASALTAAALAEQLAETKPADPGVLVVVLPHADEADAFADDLALFTTRAVALLPALESLDDESLADDPASAERLALVKRLTVGQAVGQASACHDSRQAKACPTGDSRQAEACPTPIVVTSIQALLAPLADPREIEASTRRLEVGGRLDPLELADWLAARGWQAADAIDRPGTFARRGGIVDLFAVDWDRPVRVELFGDEIESLRTFDTVSQRSVDTLQSIDLTALGVGSTARRTHLADILPAGSWWALVEPGECAEEAKRSYERLKGAAEVSDPEEVFARIYRFPSVTLAAVAPSSLEATATLAVESVERFTGVLDRVCEELGTVGKDQEVWIVAPTEAEEQRLR